MQSQLPDEKIEELMQEHQPRIRNFILRRCGNPDLADDLTQDVLLRIHKSRHTFNPEKGEFSSWSLRIAQNVLSTDYRKRKTRDEQSMAPEISETIPDESRPENEIDQKNLLNQIKSAMECLPEPERTVIINKEIKIKKLAETAEELGVTVRTVSRRLLSAYDLLKEELSKRGITPDQYAS